SASRTIEPSTAFSASVLAGGEASMIFPGLALKEKFHGSGKGDNRGQHEHDAPYSDALRRIANQINNTVIISKEKSEFRRFAHMLPRILNSVIHRALWIIGASAHN